MSNLKTMAAWIPLETREKITNDWYPSVENGDNNFQSSLEELFKVYNEYIYSGQTMDCPICRTKVRNHFRQIITIWTNE